MCKVKCHSCTQLSLLFDVTFVGSIAKPMDKHQENVKPKEGMCHPGYLYLHSVCAAPEPGMYK